MWNDQLVDMPFEVRPFTSTERDGVLELAPRLTIGVSPWRDPAAVALTVRGWLENPPDTDRGGAAFVCVVGDRVIGFISVGTTEHFTGERDAYIGELVVDEEFEGRGVGRRLAAAAEEWARTSGYRCMTLHTGAANGRARRFYAGLGYDEEDIKLTKVLAPPSDRVAE